MTIAQANITLGTAGHIDHGKTALVKSLTGCETDRLKEEKQRGMSIDLGFAPCTIADMQVGIVDVPGHEDFIKTMVAGASGIDGVILVVAADDGVMPQTREHFDILTLLGVRHGLVALTKVDRVDAEQRELAHSELHDFLRGTFLENAPILPVSNVTGEGFDAFYEALAALVAAIRPKRVDGVFRLPVERAFSVQGYGTVVAGIPVAGCARAGDEVVLLPQGTVGRIRRIEVYGRPSDVVLAGQCAALNVGHWDHHAIHRGCTLATPGYFGPESWYAATLRLLGHPKLHLKSGAQVRFHTGTSEVTASVYSLAENQMLGGGEYLVQLRPQTPIVAGPGDRYILRMLSPVATIGGGTIIEAVPRRLKRNWPNVREDLAARAAATGDERHFVEYCTRTAAAAATTEGDLARRVKIPAVRLKTILAELVAAKRVLAIPAGLYMHAETAAEQGRRLLEAVAQFHRHSAESPGIPPDELRAACQLEKAVFEALIALLVAQGRLAERNGRLALPEHRVAVADENARYLAAIEALFRDAPFHPPGEEEVVTLCGAPLPTVRKVLTILREHGRLVRVEDLLFHCDAVERARAILIAELEKEGRLESVRFKYLLDNTARKYALPLLDYFDRVGVTRRVGNTRFLKTPPSGRSKPQ
jgi:selenocysteine-specific elongation factor